MSYFLPYNYSIWVSRPITRGGRSGSRRHFEQPAARPDQTFTVFEGTSEIQRLFISRVISGVHISSRAGRLNGAVKSGRVVEDDHRTSRPDLTQATSTSGA